MNRYWFEQSLKAYIEHKYLCGTLYVNGSDALLLKEIIKRQNKSEILKFIFEVAKTPFLDFKKEHELFFLDNAFDFIEPSINVYKNSSNELEYSLSFPINSLFDLMYHCKSEFELITIFRLEDENGNGIYTSDVIKPPEYKNHQTMPYDEQNFKFLFKKDSNGLKTSRTKDWFFAFKSLDSLEKWFGSDLDSMLEYITVYEVPKKFIIEGQKQIIFKKDKATFKQQYI